MPNIYRSRKSGFVPRSGGRKRETQWLELPTISFVLAAANTPALLLALTTAEKALRPFTIIRTRGTFLTISDQTSATEYYDTAIGGCVVSDQAVAIGVTAVPTPTTDRASDLWFLYEETKGLFDFATGIGFQENMGPGSMQSFDSRAMRKVEEGQDVIIVGENSGESGGATTRLSGRMLIKLH